MPRDRDAMPRDKISQTEITKALRGAAKAGFKVRSLDRHADGFTMVFDDPSAPAEAPAAESNEWDTVR